MALDGVEEHAWQMLLAGLVICVPFFVLCASVVLAKGARMQVIVLISIATVVLAITCVYFYAFVIVKDEEAGYLLIVSWPVNLLLALWLLVTVLWSRGGKHYGTAT